ncbi:MAG: copper chaperone PCu(A)C [Caulobacterales bacterium]
MRLTAVLLVLCLATAAGSASAATILVQGAWIRATPQGAATAAGYVTFTNKGPTSDRLTGGRTDVAGAVEVHQMTMTGGVMRMRALPAGLPIGASATLKLSPNGDHLMLIGLKRPLKAGEHVTVTLSFSRAGDVKVDFPVLASAPGGMPGMPGMH